jgi:hypothetical protein
MGYSSAIRAASDAGSEADIEPSATTPLLLHGHTDTTAHDHHNHSHHHHDQDQSPATPKIHHHHNHHPKYFVVLLILFVGLFVVAFGDFMLRAPWMRIQEDIVCRDYYWKTFPNEFKNPYDPIPEDRCKVPDVQGRLAKLRGWDQTMSCIPGILTAVPYGVIADKYGRKIVLFLSLFGVILGAVWIEFTSLEVALQS